MLEVCVIKVYLIIGVCHILYWVKLMFKEIVTKAVIGKGKKTFRNTYELFTTDNISTVLGCWVINHTMSGSCENGKVKIVGSFDVNIWYSYDDNTKTNVDVRKISYTERVSVRLNNDQVLTNNSEILVTSLKNPTVIDVSNSNNKITYEIEKTLGIEIIGDTKVRVQIMDNVEDYDIIEEDIDSIVDHEIKEDYLM